MAELPRSNLASRGSAVGLKFGKHLQLSQAQKMMLAAAAVGIFMVVFTIVASKALISQRNYQANVIDAKQTALDQLKSNQKAVKSLVSSYKTFQSSPLNMLGGTANGTSTSDGDNATLVMQALPDKYDFPALASSLEKIITSQSMQIKSITGQDDQANQESNTTSSAPKPVPMPFSVSAEGTYDQVRFLVGVFERSIRPFQIQTVDFKGDQNAMTVTITAQTYYQPAKNFNIVKQVVK